MEVLHRNCLLLNLDTCRPTRCASAAFTYVIKNSGLCKVDTFVYTPAQYLIFKYISSLLRYFSSSLIALLFEPLALLLTIPELTCNLHIYASANCLIIETETLKTQV